MGLVICLSPYASYLVLMLGSFGGKRAGMPLDAERGRCSSLKRARFGSWPYFGAIGAPHLCSGLSPQAAQLNHVNACLAC